MATPHRPQFPGGLYHVTVRGVDRRRIVRDDIDRELWEALLGRAIVKSDAVLHAWCLMTNHSHLVVETPRGNIADLMQRHNSTYARTYNRRHGRVGHLFQDRYFSILIQKESHLLETARYVVLNPVRARACERAEDWPWSSYRATAGLTDGPRWLTTSWLLEHFAHDVETARARYTEFVAEGAPAASIAGLLRAA
jgi:REP element-mobilizing transposase RayT